jgi:DNA-binding NarL/FixJ family response regulator
VIRVVLADDHALLRNGLRTILEANHQIEVVAEASNGAEAVDAATRLHPDVVLMDIEMPGMDGIEATTRVLETSPTTRVLVLTTFDLDDYILRALRAGAAGFLLKAAEPAEIIRSVHACAAGQTELAPSVVDRMVQTFLQTQPQPANGAAPSQLSPLTPRELDVLRLLAQGLSNHEIARRMYLSEATVKTHVTRLLTKLRVRDRMQAVVVAYETGFIRPGQN